LTSRRTYTKDDLVALSLAVREHIIRMSTDGGCFIGASLSCADLLVHLYTRVLRISKETLDDPERDEIIAREMGWTQLLDAKDWSSEVDALLDEGSADQDETDIENISRSADTFEEHDLYRAAFALTIWIDQLFDENASFQNEPAAVKLATHAALASAKLAAALSGDNLDEIGMTIAYLKRALKAITISMEAAAQLRTPERKITPSQYAALQHRLFRVRDGIITLMGDYRSEWRRRFGPENFRG